MGRRDPSPTEREGGPAGTDGVEPSTREIALEPEIAFLNRPGLDRELLNRALRFARERHGGQMRRSGEPHLHHVVEAARILDELRLDSVTLAAAILHDVVEDTDTDVDAIRKEFGEEIAHLVDAVTKIGEIRIDSPEKEQAENFRKMLLSMARDIRVILIKLADRLHNMRTLQHLPAEKIERISRETLEIYAPLAHRFGIARIKWELEDLSLKYLEPVAYRELVARIADTRETREGQIEYFKEPLQAKLHQYGIQAEVVGRPKHFYSIYNKMKGQNLPLEEIYDLLALRVIVGSVQECYHVLGIVHTLYTPVHDRFKDYIATPKSNMYQSLHTTVIGPEGRMVEFQIRTRKMHQTAEYGIAAHWRYKEGGASDHDLDQRLSWLRQVVDWQKDLTDPKEFLDLLKKDLFHHEVFVFTPGGDLKRLPRGSTPLDFAFAVHTEVGFHCAGAKVDGRIVPLRYELRNGETVEIITSHSAAPTHDWLHVVKTSRARSKIRSWLKRESFHQSKQLGKVILERELHKLHFRGSIEKKLAEHVEEFGLSDPDQVLAAIGSGDLSGRQVAVKLVEKEPGPQPPEPLSLERIIDLTRRSERGVRIHGVDQLMIRFAKCCQPLPGDRIVGVVTRGRGVSVHRVDCPNVFPSRIDPERVLEVEWDVGKGQNFPVKILIRAEDRPGLLADVAKVIGKMHSNIRSADVLSEETDAQGVFLIEVTGLKHLHKVIKAIRAVKGVIDVERRELH
ncbi:MAG: bifunctional (p)ppGpp synthetase/guanosine-3',5'-bis(diphosphate) 3'-pyrophosphohydrolase [Candidatus Eisenbacteria bacterium]|nr:bifunctional (p)ppGpp synthetase/guanosine-3',5'-bis(diphosphate) 3'-pyrophosphohydrolase [Candidatus Eisenbacteria bacterium]